MGPDPLRQVLGSGRTTSVEGQGPLSTFPVTKCTFPGQLHVSQRGKGTRRPASRTRPLGPVSGEETTSTGLCSCGTMGVTHVAQATRSSGVQGALHACSCLRTPGDDRTQRPLGTQGVSPDARLCLPVTSLRCHQHSSALSPLGGRGSPGCIFWATASLPSSPDVASAVSNLLLIHTWCSKPQTPYFHF